MAEEQKLLDQEDETMSTSLQMGSLELRQNPSEIDQIPSDTDEEDQAYHSQLKESILSFNLDDCSQGNQGYSRVLLQLFGILGHGKSSLINSCKYVLDDGRFTECIKAPQREEGLAMIRRSYSLTNTITIVDNRGWRLKMRALQQAEVYAQLGNLLPLDLEVDWTDDANFNSLMDILHENIPDPSAFIVPVFVYSAKKSLEKEAEAAEVRMFFESCKEMTGVYPISVITHRSSGEYSTVKKKLRELGAVEVIGIENYTKEDHIKTLRKNAAILRFIDTALQSVQRQMAEPRNPKRDHIKHRKFLLQKIHEAILAKEEKGEHPKEVLGDQIKDPKKPHCCLS